VEGDAEARFDEAVSARAKQPDRQWQLGAYRAICKEHLVPQRAHTAEVIGALLEDLGPEMDEIEATFEDEMEQAQGAMWQLVADAKRRAVRDNCKSLCSTKEAEAASVKHKVCANNWDSPVATSVVLRE
jgi:hypothetical protein